MKIMFNDLSKQWNEIKFDVKPRFEKLFNKSDFIGGMAIAEFEKKGRVIPIFKELHEICQKHEGLWSVEAETYLLENAANYGLIA